MNYNSTDITYDALPINYCNTTSYTSELQSLAESIELDFAIWVNFTSLYLTGDFSSPVFSIIEVDVVRWVGNSSWMSDDDIYYNYYWENLYPIYMVTELDPDNNSTFTTQAFEYSKPYYFNLDMVQYRYTGVVANYIAFENGSSSMFYSMEEIYYETIDLPVQQYLMIHYIHMANYVWFHEMRTIYEPVTSSLRNLETQSDINAKRALEESKSEELMTIEYFSFYFIAQIGGLYTFLILILGLWMGWVTQKSLNLEIVNYYNIKLSENVHQKRNSYVHNSNGKPSEHFNADMQNPQVYNHSQMKIGYGSPQDQNNNRYSSAYNQMYNGGEYEMEELARSRNRYGPSIQYTSSDLMYSIFWWKSNNNDRHSKAGRYNQLQKQLNDINEQRDMINVISVITKMKNRMSFVEKRLAELANNPPHVPQEKKVKESQKAVPNQNNQQYSEYNPNLQSNGAQIKQ